jgi:hypothetical protein
MNNLLTAIMTRTTGSDLSTDVGGRIYLDRAPDGSEYPYVVFFIIAGTPDKTFTEHYTDTLIQFSLFSSSSGALEITTMYKDLKALFDEWTALITDNRLVRMNESNLMTMFDDIVTPTGIVGIRHWAVDFEIKTSLN